MSTDWPSLFASAGIEWRTRGPNTSRGNTNVACPWCAADPSYHLSVSDDIEAYACRRNSSHKGRDFLYLLTSLGLSRTEAALLLARYSRQEAVQAPPVVQAPSALLRTWARFMPAVGSPQALAYLEARGFLEPAVVAERYGLRFAPRGTWAQRLLIPYWEGDRLLSWTGRAWRPRATPKYLTEAETEDGLVYMPRPPRGRLLIVEGPIDALKVAAATETMDVAALALTGKAVNTQRIYRIARLLGRSTVVSLVLDTDALPSEVQKTLDLLRGGLASMRKPASVARLSLPEGRKDCGEMSYGEIKTWLSV